MPVTDIHNHCNGTRVLVKGLFLMRFHWSILGNLPYPIISNLTG